MSRREGNGGEGIIIRLDHQKGLENMMQAPKRERNNHNEVPSTPA